MQQIIIKTNWRTLEALERAQVRLMEQLHEVEDEKERMNILALFSLLCALLASAKCPDWDSRNVH